MAHEQTDGMENVEEEPRPRISFGSWSEYSFDMTQFQGADGSVNDFRWKCQRDTCEYDAYGRQALLKQN